MMGLTQKGTLVLRGRSLIALCVGGDQWRRWANFIVSSRFPYHLKRTPQKMCATFLTLPYSNLCYILFIIQWYQLTFPHAIYEISFF